MVSHYHFGASFYCDVCFWNKNCYFLCNWRFRNISCPIEITQDNNSIGDIRRSFPIYFNLH